MYSTIIEPVSRFILCQFEVRTLNRTPEVMPIKIKCQDLQVHSSIFQGTFIL